MDATTHSSLSFQSSDFPPAELATGKQAQIICEILVKFGTLYTHQKGEAYQIKCWIKIRLTESLILQLSIVEKKGQIRKEHATNQAIQVGD